MQKMQQASGGGRTEEWKRVCFLWSWYGRFFKPHVGFAAPYASICFGLHNNEVVPILFLQSAILELQEKCSPV